MALWVGVFLPVPFVRNLANSLRFTLFSLVLRFTALYHRAFASSVPVGTRSVLSTVSVLVGIALASPSVTSSWMCPALRKRAYCGMSSLCCSQRGRVFWYRLRLFSEGGRCRRSLRLLRTCTVYTYVPYVSGPFSAPPSGGGQVGSCSARLWPRAAPPRRPSHTRLSVCHPSHVVSRLCFPYPYRICRRSRGRRRQ